VQVVFQTCRIGGSTSYSAAAPPFFLSIACPILIHSIGDVRVVIALSDVRHCTQVLTVPDDMPVLPPVAVRALILATNRLDDTV
jgi:hypothetical protein